jgi:endonuclease/exonuclease/phosphatase family metal-dependent hydrolase
MILSDRSNSLRLLVLIAAALLVSACQDFRKEPGLLEAVGALPPPPTDLRIASFNIRYGTAPDGDNAWSNRRDLVIDVIAAQRPDILGLQEALRDQIDDLRAALPEYAQTGVGRDDGRQSGEYCAILFRRDRLSAIDGGTFWFSDTPQIPGSKDWGNRITRICTWVRLRERADGAGGGTGRGRTLTVYNLHLDHESEPSRRRSAELLAARILANSARHADDAVIVTGDFNCGESSPAIRFLTGAAPSAVEGSAGVPGWTGLIDTFRIAQPDAADVGTFHAFKGVAGPEKIDFVFVRPPPPPSRAKIEVLSAEIDRSSRNGRWPSDHFPVVAEIRLLD